MRLRIRTLLLTVALLCSMTSISSACIYIPILDPFYWLFGGCGYGAGGVSGGGYGYVNNGNSSGYGPNPYGVSRCVDDWLGYGYLRNQEGTLGHYPGRPVSCYNPVFPCLLNPATWFPPCPLFAPYTPFGPACGVTAPMVAPLAPPIQVPYQPYPAMPYQQPMPFQGQCQNGAPWQLPMPQFAAPRFAAPQYAMPRAPMPQMFNQYGGMYGNPCGPQCMPQQQCMPQPMMQCQPMQVPVTTMRPVTVDRGYWQRVWVPRPVTTMVPQTQYMTSAPAMQMPYMQNQFMGSPMMDSGCGCDAGGGCDCGGSMGDMMPGADMMQGSGYPDMNSGSGCCGSDGGMMQQNYESGVPSAPPGTMIPQSTMMMSPGSMTMSRSQMSQMQMSRMAMGQPGNIAPYSSMSRWYSNPGSTPQYSNSAYGRSATIRPGYGTTMTGQMQTRSYANNMAMAPMTRMPTPQSSGWQVVPTPRPQMPMAQAMPQQMRTVPMQMRNVSPMTAQMMPQQFSPMQSQRPMSPMIGSTMPRAVVARPKMRGDIHGDHQLTGPTSSAMTVVPNSFNGRAPIQQASWTQPTRTSTAQKYPNSVQ